MGDNRTMSTPVTPVEDLTTVFVSYSRVDQKSALPVIHLLKQAGYSVWWDGMLEAGERYLESTEHALETARAVVVLWSKNSVQSDWVRDEAMSGRDRKCLVPISLDGSIPPLGFRQLQVIDLSHWTQQDDSPRSAEILRVLATLHERPLPARLPPRPHTSPLSRRTLLLTGAAVGAASLVAGLTLQDGWPNFGASSLAASGVVVLPFENLSGDADNSVLASALDIEVRKALSRNPALKVVARTSSVAVQNSGMSAAEICSELGVECLLEGTISLSQERLKISTSLIEGRTGLVRWSQDYEGVPSNILEFQSEIAQAVIANVTSEIAQPQSRAKFGGTTDASAFQEYLLGREAFRGVTNREDVNLAHGHFDRALQIDPNFAEAFAIKARLYAYSQVFANGSAELDQLSERALEAAQTAIRLAPDSADAHSTLGNVYFETRLDIAAASQAFLTSRELGFGNAAIMARYALFAACNGQTDAALAAINRALELDPLNPTFYNRSGLISYLLKRYPEAITAYNRSHDLRPRKVHLPSDIGLARYYLGQPSAALESCQTEATRQLRLPCEAIALHALGEADHAAAVLQDLIHEFGDTMLYQQAQIQAQFGDLDAAFVTLRKALNTKDPGLIILKVDPAFEALHGQEDFSQLLASLGFQP